jgi:hypothetical protein
VIHHSPNEIGIGNSTAVARAIAKGKHMGMVPGWPDIECFLPCGPIFLEIKAPQGTVTANQRAVHEALAALGYRVAVVRSVDDAAAALAGWGIGTREAGK